MFPQETFCHTAGAVFSPLDINLHFYVRNTVLINGCSMLRAGGLTAQGTRDTLGETTRLCFFFFFFY